MDVRVDRDSVGPEAYLLLACARSSHNTATRDRIRFLAGRRPDWERLVQLSRLHGTIPLLYRTLSTVCPDLVPTDAAKFLRSHYCAVAMANVGMTTTLVEIVEFLKESGISTLPLKGPALAALAYGDVTLREFGDLDILVRKSDLAASLNALASRGFVLLKRQDLSDETKTNGKYFPLVSEREGFVVDLQWMIADEHFSFSLESPAFWERTQPIELNSTKIPCLSPEAILLILSIHGCKHLWSRLKWTCDVAELLRSHPEMDWLWVLQTARDLGCRRMVLVGLFLAREALDAPVPDHILDHIMRDRGVKAVASPLLQRLRAGEEPKGPDHDRNVKYLGMRDRRRDRIRFTLHLCCVIDPKDVGQLQQFPTLFRVLYYGLLPFRIITRHALRTWHLKTALSEWLERMG